MIQFLLNITRQQNGLDQAPELSTVIRDRDVYDDALFAACRIHQDVRDPKRLLLLNPLKVRETR
ncbi:hypothetical protein D3C73_1607470 [compost metagenome]